MKKATAILWQLFHSQWHPFHFHLSLFSHNPVSNKLFFNQNGLLLRQLCLCLLRDAEFQDTLFKLGFHILSSPVADEFSPFIRRLAKS